MNAIEKLKYAIASTEQCPDTTIFCCKCSNTGSDIVNRLTKIDQSPSPNGVGCIEKIITYPGPPIYTPSGGTSGPRVVAEQKCVNDGGVVVGEWTQGQPLPNPSPSKQCKAHCDRVRQGQNQYPPEEMPEEEAPPREREQPPQFNSSAQLNRAKSYFEPPACAPGINCPPPASDVDPIKRKRPAVTPVGPFISPQNWQQIHDQWKEIFNGPIPPWFKHEYWPFSQKFYDIDLDWWHFSTSLLPSIKRAGTSSPLAYWFTQSQWRGGDVEPFPCRDNKGRVWQARWYTNY